MSKALKLQKMGLFELLKPQILISRNFFIILPKGRTPTKYPMFFSFPCWRRTTSKERVMLNTLFPKVLALVSIVEVKFNRVFVIALKQTKIQISILWYFYMREILFYTRKFGMIHSITSSMGCNVTVWKFYNHSANISSILISRKKVRMAKKKKRFKFPNWE